MYLLHKFGHQFGATLLVSGITIGVGMLALPLATAEAGFFPSLLIYLVSWLFMVCTGLLIAEACTWMPKNANLVTLAEGLLGKIGKAFCWIIYLFLFFCLMIAHVAGAGDIIEQIIPGFFPHWASVILYALIFAPVVYLGTLWVDRLNLLLMLGVAVSFLFFIVLGLPHIKISLLKMSSWSKAVAAMPVIFTAFGFQSLVPTLMSYLRQDLHKVRSAIIWGTAIPFFLYFLWQILILGIVPPDQLVAAFSRGENPLGPLHHILVSPLILNAGKAFSFFALSTSSVGIAIAFVDFLADGFKMKKTAVNKLLLCGIVFLLPALIAILNPHIFISALRYAGGYGVALLLGAMPILMVWSGRYYKGHSLLHRQIPGGKLVLSLLLAFVIFEIFVQLTY